jgi:hypothetical protein
MLRFPRASWHPIVLSFTLFCLNAYICRELFTAGFIGNLSSNEAAFVSIARFFQLHPGDWQWFPWFNGGMPIENAYQPLLPVATALAGSLSGWPLERAFHCTMALAFCCGPVTLFWFVFDWSASLAAAFFAGLIYSLASPAEWVIPILRLHGEGWGSLRLFNLIRYAEDPHIAALTLLPIALLFLRRGKLLPAVIASSAVVLTNGFGAVDLAIGCLCIALSLRRGMARLMATGLVTWLLISPWLPPSLLLLMNRDQWSAHGYYHGGLAIVAALAAFAALWFITRPIASAFERFAILLALPMLIIPAGYFLLNMTLVPQASRYQLEFEMAAAILLAALLARIPRQWLVVAALIAASIPLTKSARRFARPMLQPIDIAQTIQYKTDRWLNQNLPGSRAMVSGDTEFLYNAISENPQMSGGHEPTVPDLVNRFAIYEIYTDTAAGDHAADVSLIWLKAFGNSAVTIPAEKSRENYHPFTHPHKFDGALPVLRHEEDDTIFAIPRRSNSLAHVLPRNAVVSREPIHGLDLDPVRPYVAALEDPAMPVATLTWQGPSRGTIVTTMKPDQLISVQETYAPGWRATSGSSEIPVRKDGLGLMVLAPHCNGPCEVDLRFGASAEAWLCRILCTIASLTILILPRLE